MSNEYFFLLCLRVTDLVNMTACFLLHLWWTVITHTVYTLIHTHPWVRAVCRELDCHRKNRPETNISIVPDGINSRRSETLALSVDSAGWLTAWKRFQNKHHIRLIIHELRGFKSNNKAGRNTELLGALEKISASQKRRMRTVTQKGLLFFSQLAGKYFIQRLCGRCAPHSAVLMGT